MRKLLALLLSVLMLASLLAAIPAFAATATYDGTTRNDATKLVITEIGADMTYYRNGNATVSGLSTIGSMDFIEIYNNGAGSIELDSLSLLLGVEIDKVPTDAQSPYIQHRVSEDYPLWKEWRDHYRFISEIEIKDDVLIDATTAGQYTALPNNIYTKYLTNAGEDMTLADGETAVIWLITAKTVEWLVWADANVTDFDPKTEFLRSYYGGAVDPDDYKVVMVWAYSDGTVDDPFVLADDMFNFENAPSVSGLDGTSDLDWTYIIGVANDTWNVGSDAAYNETTQARNVNLYCMSMLGARVPGYVRQSGYTATYAPAAAIPYIQNAYNKLLNSNATDYTDYLDAGLIESYREAGVINWVSDPTPGQMPVWQWAIVDPDDAKAPDSLKTEGVKDATKVAAAIHAYVEELNYVDDGANAGRDETGIDREYNFESQEDIKNRFNNKKKKDDTTEEGGLATWALILIIVGGVLVVAGGACAVVFLVILPKKKAAAAASADEAFVADAPVEEIPVEDAPAAEENKEE